MYKYGFQSIKPHIKGTPTQPERKRGSALYRKRVKQKGLIFLKVVIPPEDADMMKDIAKERRLLRNRPLDTDSSK